MEASKRIEDALLTLAWSLWTELGVAGVERHHQDCVVDPEALILFTSTLTDCDRRLRDEALDCILAIAPSLFVSRLKILLHGATPSVQTRFGPLAATFNKLSKSYVRFPKGRSDNPWNAVPSGKSERGSFDRPSQVMLRSRSIFGVAARADVVTAIVCVPRLGWTASELAERTCLAKRVVAGTLQDLERGGVLRATAIGNRLRYDLVSRTRLEALIGARPGRMPFWASILPFAAGVRSLTEHAAGRNETALLVDAQKLVTGFLGVQARLGREFGSPSFESWSGLVQWLATEMELIANGTSRWLDEPAVAVGARRAKQLHHDP